jgi:iron complex transport system substrate-binding protein
MRISAGSHSFLFPVLIAFISIGWLACSPNHKKPPLPVAEVVTHVVPKYAKGFDWKLLSDSTVQITLFNLESKGDTLQVIRWKQRPINRMACLSTTHIPFIAALQGLPMVKGCGFADRIMDVNAQQMVASQQILNLTNGNELDPEVVFSIEPDLLFVYPFGGKAYDKFLSKGIGCVQISEYLEKHPLGRAEWIRLFGCLLNRQQQADSLFTSIEARYVIARDSIARSISQRPRVFAGSMDGDRWAVPSVNSYLATIMHDAGAQYIFTDSSATGNLVLPFESFYAAAATADFWGKIIYDKNPLSADVITQGDNRLREIPAFKNRHVFFCNALETDYHGQALLEPHVLLSDLAHIFSDSIVQAEYSYFKPWLYYD